MTAPTPQSHIRYVTPDGRLTSEGIQLFLAWLATLNDLEARVSALE